MNGELEEYGDLIPKFEKAHSDLEKKVAAFIKPEVEAEKHKSSEKKLTNVRYIKGKKGVPEFWPKALKHSILIRNEFREKDKEIMKHILHVETTHSINEAKKKVLTLKM